MVIASSSTPGLAAELQRGRLIAESEVSPYRCRDNLQSVNGHGKAIDTAIADPDVSISRLTMRDSHRSGMAIIVQFGACGEHKPPLVGVEWSSS